MTHPGASTDDIAREMELEQAHIDRAYAVLDAIRDGATADAAGAPAGDDAAAGGTHQERFERERVTADARRRAAELRWGDPPLVFGRLDRDDGDVFYVGRVGVFDDEHDPLVVDWRAPVAEAFYRATRADPFGLRRRRSFRCRGRRLLGLDDVLFSELDDDAPVIGEAALLAALDAPRQGRMTDHVATVQAEQDEIIRAPMAGVTLVQGAAGTGKTVVALHRAAYLLYTHRDVLDRQGVLIIGPNTRFLDYVRDVLPELGEHDAELTVVADLYPGVDAVPERSIDVAALKADLRMVGVIRRAVRTRQRRLRSAVDVPFGRFVLKLEPDGIGDVVRAARRARGTHNERRVQVEAGVIDRCYAEFRRRNTARSDRMRDPGRDAFGAAIAEVGEFQILLERIWPVLDPKALLHDLFGSHALLRAATGDELTDDERDLLWRPRSRDDDAVAWTDADVPLLHEAFAHLGAPPREQTIDAGPDEDTELMVDRVIDHVRLGLEHGMDAVMEADLRRSVLGEVKAAAGIDDEPPPRDPTIPRVWGAVLVDEAQDISPMAWRMLMRSCPNQSVTIVGDVAQGTRPWSPRTWDEVVEWAAPRHAPRRHDLHINYRTPTEVMRVAAPLSAAPEAATAVRSTGRPPTVYAVVDPVAAAGRVVEELVTASRGRSVGAIVAAATALETVAALEESGAAVHTPETVKGLEFDEVVVVEPAALAEGAGGLAAVYIAVTRTTSGLHLVHSRPLPAPIATALTDDQPASASA